MNHLLIRLGYTDNYRDFQTLQEVCGTLQVLNFNVSLFPGTARFLSSIPSGSISLIRVFNSPGFGDVLITYSDSWPWESFGQFERHRSPTSDADLGVRAFGWLSSEASPAIFQLQLWIEDPSSGLSRPLGTGGLGSWDGETPLFETRLEEELGNRVDLELILAR